MSFLDLVQDYVTLYKAGKHMVGPCPKCGGAADSTRFVVNLVKDFGNCYSCGFNADSVRLLREMEGVSCPEAHRLAGIDCDSPECPMWSKCSRGKGERESRQDDRATPAARSRKQRGFTPSAAETPVDMWQRHAMDMVMRCHQRLLDCPEQLAYLAGRGLPLEAVIKYRLGWIPELEFKNRKAWGLQDKWNDEDKRWIKVMPFHKGILIPWFIDDRVHRLRYRKSEVTGPKDPRYMWVDGSGTDVLCLNPEARAHCIVESDLCGLLIDWLAGDLVGAVPLGSCSTHPKATVHELLCNSLRILVATDFDAEMRGEKVHAPGAKASHWWTETFPGNARRWPVPKGKDPGEAYAAGADLRAWVLAGLPPAMTVRSPHKSKKKQEEPQVGFDSKKAQQMITDTLSLINTSCPKGAREWIASERPVISKNLIEVERAVDRAFEAEDEKMLAKNLDALKRYHLRAFAVYEGRPPVIEVEK